jgi:hypothetical protein
VNPEDPVLTIARTSLQESVRRLRKVAKASSEPVCLGYADGTLTISWTGSSEQVPAVGQWPDDVHVPAGWLRALARALPAADPLTLRVSEGRVYTESLSCPVVAPAAAESNLVSLRDRELRIARATAALKAFRIGREDIEYLVDRAELEARRRYHPDEDRLLKSVAEAWASLAVFGVDADEIYGLVQRQIRQAWTSGGSNV